MLLIVSKQYVDGSICFPISCFRGTVTKPIIARLQVPPDFIAADCRLPYGMTLSSVVSTVNRVYDFMADLNQMLIDKGYSTIEEILLGNTYSGMLSEVIVKTLADESPALVRNDYVRGHPDLLPATSCPEPNPGVQNAAEGIEVKTSRQKGG